MDENIIFTNFVYKKSKYYFLYISEIKAYGIGYFFKMALSKILKIPMNKIEFITIAPDIFEQYNYDNLIIINSFKDKNKRVSQNEFSKLISKSSYINFIVETILQNQNELYIYMYESNINMNLDNKDRVFLVGPDKKLVNYFNNKIELYKELSLKFLMADFIYCKGFKNLIKDSSSMLKKYKKIFISLERSAAGANSIIACNIEDIKKRFSKNYNDNFLITQYIEHFSDPTTLGVVINKKEIFVAGIADQIIEGTKFKGSIYPSKLPKKIQQEIIELTKKIGKEIAKKGYRGIFGCDFIVSKDNKIYLVEINPRKQGTTMEFCCTLQHRLKKDAPNLPEIEYYAVMKQKVPPNMGEFKKKTPLIYWGTYNYKVDKKQKTTYYLPQNVDELKMFNSLYKKKVKKEFIILEHVGQNLLVEEGSFLARVVATGQSFEDVDSGIEFAKKIIESTIKGEKYGQI